MTKAKVTFPSAPDTSAIDIQDEGSVIVSNPTALNFTGPGVTVTENPSGTAEVDIPGLQYWTESEDAATQQSTIFTPNNSATNVNAVLLPKGNGANLAQTPDGTTTGGNARGQYATDWQKNRNNANEVASGNYSTISGGRNNRASATDSTVGGGQNNLASGTGATVVGGQNNTASSTGAVVGGRNNTSAAADSIVGGFGNSATQVYSVSFGQSGIVSAQWGTGFGSSARSYISYQAVFGGGSAVQQSFIPKVFDIMGAGLTSGATQTVNIGTPVGRIWNAHIKCTMFISFINGTATGVSVNDTLSVFDILTVKRFGGTSVILGSPTNVYTANDASMASASFSYSISSGNLAVTITAPTFVGGGSVRIQSAIGVHLTEYK